MGWALETARAGPAAGSFLVGGWPAARLQPYSFLKVVSYDCGFSVCNQKKIKLCPDKAFFYV